MGALNKTCQERNLRFSCVLCKNWIAVNDHRREIKATVAEQGACRANTGLVLQSDSFWRAEEVFMFTVSRFVF